MTSFKAFSLWHITNIWFVEFTISFSKKKKDDVSVFRCLRVLMEMAHKFGSRRKSCSELQFRDVATRTSDALCLPPDSYRGTRQVMLWQSDRVCRNTPLASSGISALLKRFWEGDCRGMKRRFLPQFHLYLCAAACKRTTPNKTIMAAKPLGNKLQSPLIETRDTSALMSADCIQLVAQY
jgi:hypothetical protein